MSKYVNALTGTRGIAALSVVVFHFGLGIWPFSKMEQLFSMGNLAVSYFFVLSGFVMMWTYHNKSISFVAFMQKRVARIVPLYIFALLLCILYFLYSYYQEGKALEDDFGFGVLLNASFLQAYFPKYVLAINSPGWSLSVEMFFYLLFPLILIFAKGRKQLFVITTVIFFIVSQVVHWYMFTKVIPANNLANVHELTFYHPVFHLNQFLLGMLGVYLYPYVKRYNSRFLPLMLFSSIILVLLFPFGLSLHNGLLAPLFLLFILSVVEAEPYVLRSKPLVFLGDISYGIYILQFPVYFYMKLVNDKLLDLSNTGFFYIYIISLLIFSSICYSTIELPLRKRIAKV